MCTGAPPGRAAAPHHRAVPPAPLPCPTPSCQCHVHLDFSTARGWGVLPDSWGSAGCQVGWRCVCLPETLPGLVHPKSTGCCRCWGAQEARTAGGHCMPQEAAAASCGALEHTGLWKPIPIRPLQGHFQIQQDRFAGNLSLCPQSKSSGKRQKQLSFRQTSAEARGLPRAPCSSAAAGSLLEKAVCHAPGHGHCSVKLAPAVQMQSTPGSPGTCPCRQGLQKKKQIH